MIGYRFLSPAEDEMSEAALFYDTVGLGNDFLDDVQVAIHKLREYPQSGQVVTSPLRRMLLHRFPFSIIYSEEPDSILVIAVAHHSRRPDYWRSRIESY